MTDIEYQGICEGSLISARGLIEEQDERPLNRRNNLVDAHRIKNGLRTVLNAPGCEKFHLEAEELLAELLSIFPDGELE